MQTKPTLRSKTKSPPKSAYHYDSDIDYYNAFIETYEEQAEAEIENGVSDEVIEQLISDNYNEIEEWLYESGRVYEYLVSYYKEQWEMNQEP